MIEQVFTQNQIPYQLVGGTRFYDRQEIKTILAYLYLVENPDDNISFSWAIQHPNSGIGTVSIQKMIDKSQDRKVSIFNLAQTENLPLSTKQNQKVKKCGV